MVESAATAAAPPATSSDDPLIGQTINGRVKIIRPIARGGMGKVYYGEQVSMGRPCAIKILDPKAAGSGDNIKDFTRRFLLEASVTSKLTHPNAVTIFDYGESTGGICYIAMEYLEGETLSHALKTGGRLVAERTIDVSRQICRALREAHSLGVVHRDLKPGNIFLCKHDDEGDRVKVLDFGLVKENHPAEADTNHTQFGQVMGSPRYMAPEQIQGTAVDARTDIYSLGATMYAMLTGTPPFDRQNDMAAMMAHVSDPVPPMAQVAPDASIPPALEAIVRRCLEKNPDQRFASMDEVIQALKMQPGQAQYLVTGSGPFSAAIARSASTGPGRLISGTGSTQTAAAATITSVPPGLTRPKWIPFAAGGAIAAGIAAVVAMGMREEPKPPPVAAVAPVKAVAPAPPPAAAPAPPPEPTLALAVETDPAGARIKEDDIEVCAATPCTITYRGAQADAKIEHLLVITKADYKVKKQLAHAGTPVSVKLSKSQ